MKNEVQLQRIKKNIYFDVIPSFRYFRREKYLRFHIHTKEQITTWNEHNENRYYKNIERTDSQEKQ